MLVQGLQVTTTAWALIQHKSQAQTWTCGSQLWLSGSKISSWHHGANLQVAECEEPGAVGTYSPAWARARLTACEPYIAPPSPGPAVLEVLPMVLSLPPHHGRITHPHCRQHCDTGEIQLCHEGSWKRGFHKLSLPLQDTEMSRAGSSSSKEGTDQLIQERGLRQRGKRHLTERKAVGMEESRTSSSALEMCMLGMSPTSSGDPWGRGSQWHCRLLWSWPAAVTMILVLNAPWARGGYCDKGFNVQSCLILSSMGLKNMGENRERK